MKTSLIPIDSPNSIQLAVAAIRDGRLVAFPTDTVYGLAADVNSSIAIEKLFIAKGRDFNKSIAVLISGLDQFSLLTPQFNPMAQRLAKAFWPGALTLVVEKLASLPSNLSSTSTLGIRMPDHSFARSLLRASGPLATTSANISGNQNPLTADDVLEQLSGRVDLVLDGGACPGGIPSTVVDCTQAEPVILREGSIPKAAILSTLQNK